MVKIPEGWIETTLSEIAEIIMGQSPKGESYNLNGDGLPFYQGVTEFSEKYVGLKTYTTQPTKVIGPGTILFSVRAPVGKVNFTKWEACIGRGNAGIIMKNGNQEYLFYLLKYIESQILKSASGTVFDSISGKELQKISVTIPENPQEQKAIAGVLSAFDDKIELLRAENQTLEEMGQTLFKEWFGKYKIEDELPDGWKVGKLGDIVSINKRGITPEYNDNKDIMVISQKSIRNSIIDLNEVYWHDKNKKYDEELNLQFMDTLINSMGTGTLGRISPYILHQSATLHSCVTLLRSNNKSNPYYLYLLVKSLENIITDMGTGSTGQTSLKNSDLGNLEIIIPSKTVMDNFEEIIKPLYKKISINLEEIQSLSNTRDQLLPKLMSGEVRVEF